MTTVEFMYTTWAFSQSRYYLCLLVKNIAMGSCTSGDYGLARQEIQKALHDTTESTVGIYLFEDKFSKF